MSRTPSLFLFLAATFVGGCAVAPEGGPESGSDADRGSVGKADLFGSCELPNGKDKCGKKGTGNCWCDDLCVEYGDCCADAADVCGIDVGEEDDDDAGECSGIVCALFCENGFQTNEDGCPICACQGQFCGGIANIQCPPGQICTGVGDFPDAGGTCEPAPGCGGFGGFLCPDGLSCIDIPDDDCDPEIGADCPGMCVPGPVGGDDGDGDDDGDEPTGPSCAGECGGAAAGAACWCDDLCTKYDDCCDDYEAECVDTPDPTECGGELCDPDEVCVTMVTQLGLMSACAEVPAACDGEPSCACMGEDVCTGAFDLCNQDENGLSCSCPVC